MEHITVSPEKVRMGGNIIDKKELSDYESDDADLSVTTEVINLEEENVFLVSTDMVPASVGLTASRTIISSITDPHSSFLIATVHDAYDNPIVGATVSFYNGATLLGNAVTDEEGDAGFTYYASNAGDMNVTAVVEGVTSNVVIIEDCYLVDTGEWNHVSDYENGILTGSPSLQIYYEDRVKEYIVYNRGTGEGMLYWDDIIEEPVIIEADLDITLVSPPIGVGVYVDDGDGFGIGVRKSYAFGWEFLNGVLTNLYGTDQQINSNYSAHIQVIINGTHLTVTYTKQSTGEVIFSTSCTIDEDLLSNSKFGIMVGEYEQSTTGPAIFNNFRVKPYIPEPSPVDTVTLATNKSVLSAYDSEVATLTATATSEESAPVEGVLVTFYKGSTVLGTATTNSSGVATLTYTAMGAGDITFTAECEEVLSDEVYTEDCISYDNASTNKVSNYSALQLESRAFINALSYDTDHYVLAHNYTPYSGYTIPDTWELNGAVEFSVDFKLSSSENVCQALLGLFWDSSTPSHMTKVRGDQLFQEYILPYDDRSGAIDTVFQRNVADFTNGYYKLKMRVVNSNVDYYVYAPDGTLLSTGVGGALPENPQENPQLFFGFLSGSGRDVHLKNMKVKSLSTVSLTSDKSVLSAFDSESATLTATVIDAHSQPVQYETVRFYKDGVSIGTATTNSSGVATLTYTATGAGDVTLTAEAENITSNNLSIEDCIRYDPTTQDKSSSYTPVKIDRRRAIHSFSFDTDHYVLSSAGEFYIGWKLADEEDNIEIQCDFQFTTADAYSQILIGYFNNTTSYCLRARGDKIVQEFLLNYNTSATESTFYTHSTAFTDKYYTIKLKRIGNTATISIHDGTTTLATHDITITSDNNAKLFFGFLSYESKTVLVRNLKAKKI